MSLYLFVTNSGQADKPIRLVLSPHPFQRGVEPTGESILVSEHDAHHRIHKVAIEQRVVGTVYIRKVC